MTSNASIKISKILEKYGGTLIYDEILPIHVEFINTIDESMDLINTCYVYSISNMFELLTCLVVTDRNFTRELDPMYKTRLIFQQSEPKSPAYNDLLTLCEYINTKPGGIKLMGKDSCKILSIYKLYKMLFKICVYICDQESRMYNYILDNFCNICEDPIDHIQTILENDRMDILENIIKKYTSETYDGKQMIIDNATDFALVCINNNSLLCYSYISILADQYINYKILLHSKLDVKPNMYPYTIDINKNIEFITCRYISNITKINGNINI
jgi:hypothetical protein